MCLRCSLVVVLSFFSAAHLFCISPDTRGLLIPVGRQIESGNQVQVSIDSLPYTKAETVDDGCGGEWLRIPFVDLVGKQQLSLIFARTNPSCSIAENPIDTTRWTSPNPLIDSDNPAVLSKAKEITSGKEGTEQKAQAILLYVVNQIHFKQFAGMHGIPASSTLVLGYGICVNHSRLFVALCRAAGIPARTVSGTILGDDRQYYHHEWAEYYDSVGCWHPLDPTMSINLNFSDLKRIDLLYDIESNPIYPFAKGWEQVSVKLPDQSLSVFCPDWTVQRRDGRMSYILLDDATPGRVTVRVDYNIPQYVR